MRLKWPKFILLIFILLLGGYIAKNEFQGIPLPFRCDGVTEYNLGDNGHEVTFSVNQDLRLEANARSVFLVRGYVFSGKEKYILNRTFELSGRQDIDKDTVILKVNRIVKSDLDNTPDTLFNIYFDEIAIEPDTLQLDIVHLEKRAWLVSNPIQFIYACARY